MVTRCATGRLLLMLGILITCSVPVVAQTVVATVPVGSNPWRVAVNSSTNKIYVTNWLDGSCAGTASTLRVINGADHTIEAVIPGACHPWGLAVNEATNQIYVANFINVRVIDGFTNTVTASFNGGSNENSAAVNPVTGGIYVGTNNALFPRVNVFNGINNTLVASVAVDGMPLVLAVNDVTNRIYVTKQYGCVSRIGSYCLQFQTSATVSVIDGTTSSEIATVPIATGLRGIAVNPTTNRTYVANPSTNSVAVIDGATNSAVASFPVKTPAEAVAVNPTTNHVYVTHPYSNKVSAIDGATGCRLTLTVGASPQAVAANPVTNRIYVANSDGTLSVIQDSSTEILCDTQPPSWLGGSALTASSIGLTSLALTWGAAVDNVGVVAYKVFQDGAIRATVSGAVSLLNVTGLAACTAYTFKVEAYDAEGNGSTDGPSATVQTLTPLDAIGRLSDQVSALAALGLLNQGQATVLTSTLQGAARQLDQGQVNAALKLLDAFVRQVNAFVNAGAISASQAQLLIAAVNEILAHPTC